MIQPLRSTTARCSCWQSDRLRQRADQAAAVLVLVLSAEC